jgi:hypothetical protein
VRTRNNLAFQLRRTTILTLAMAHFIVVPAEAAQCLVGTKQRYVWFSPESHYPPGKDADFLDLFKPEASWNDSAHHISAFKFSTQFYTKIPTDELKPVVSALRSRRIKLALEAEVGCGKYPGTPGLAEVVSRKIIDAGGSLEVIALDEPLFHVHLEKPSAGCQLSVDAAAERSASVLAVYKKYFPDVRVGVIEPFPALSLQQDWPEKLAAFVGSFQKATGVPIRFLHADIDWRHPELTTFDKNELKPDAASRLIREVSAVAARMKFSFGVIFNGKATAKSDVEWLQQARGNATLIENSGSPSEVIFQSWHRHPNKTLPDDDPASFLNIVNWFCSNSRRE